MLQEWVILLVSFCYLGILFAIAYYGDKRADAGRSIISNPYIYTLSIAVYCTAWTFYGSVGRAATTGAGFLPIYLGPTLMAALWWFVLRKIIRIAKVHRITSIADFISSRYAKDPLIGGIVTIIAVVGILPYISLQLKAVSVSFNVLHTFQGKTHILPAADSVISNPYINTLSMWSGTALYVTLAMSVFAILFGTRHIDASERHEGMVAAVAFESVVKLVAFLVAGIFVSYYLFSGPTELIYDAVKSPELSKLMNLEALGGGYTNWFTLTFLSMMAIMFLPRQFHILVVENVNEEHVKKASWLFPLYLLAINLFVLPISFAGLLFFPDGSVDPDTFVLAVPLHTNQEFVALFVYLGGLSAATGMVIVATIALSTMVCNDLVMPVLLRIRFLQRSDLSSVLLPIRRGSILVILLLGYVFFRLIGESYALVTLGLVSFAAAAQFAPVILIGIYWKGASRRGAIAGLLAGFAVWTYTLLVPSFVKSGWIATSILESGPFGIELLGPYHLFGLNMFDPLTHSVFWSMLANVGLLVGVSLFDRQNAMERLQAAHFVDVFRHEDIDTGLWSGTTTVAELKGLVGRFIGVEQTDKAFSEYAAEHDFDVKTKALADANLVGFAERKLAGAIGSASARVMISSVVKGEEISIEGLMKILDETSQVIEYSHRLEEKSRELEKATAELRAANKRLTELDRLKDEFVSTVTHELRTPLTSVRAFSEILRDNPALPLEERQKFLDIIVKESERLTRLINQVLDLAKIESGSAEWTRECVDLNEVVEEASSSISQLFHENSIHLEEIVPEGAVFVMADRDRLIQVVINLMSNAVKFCEPGTGQVTIRLSTLPGKVRVEVVDNGPGIHPDEQERIFEKFHQLKGLRDEKPRGSGLGLTICHRIIKHHGGHIWVESKPGAGSKFIFELALAEKV
ncbi:MAG: histidine kinase [Desulfobulbaceae bacterium]|uniref:histidine kinase n=1 Tax=Candidatus Desulfobia pelagia TaxID=2841692 RepID=A0A8J6NDF9_9BACT|nr:histidine kinase [Candidatus Desulfobia pelagia]